MSNFIAAEDFYHHQAYEDFLQEHYNNEYDNMGKPGSIVSYGPQWAEAGSAPFRYFKGQITEGGPVAPMIVAGPEVEWQNEIFHGLTTVMDLAPTFYEFAQVSYPDSLGNKKLYPLKGRSLKGLLSKNGEQVHVEEYVFGLEHAGRAMLRKGDWKILSNNRPFNRDSFSLYNLSEDLAETNNLREKASEKYQELLDDWDQFVKEIKPQFPPPKRKQELLFQ